MGKIKLRRDSKHRVLRRGESIRANGKYQFKYTVAGKTKFVYSWRLVPTDPQPVGTMPDLSLREKERLIGRDLESQIDPMGKSMTVKELVDRYLKTKVGVRPSTKANYKFVQNLMEKEEFNYHWQHRFNHMVNRYNEIYRVQLPNITPHVCRHTYCSNMARSGMNPKTLQYLMGHSDIGITMNTYSHLGLEDAAEELRRLEGLRKAQAEMGRMEEKEKPVTQNMFRAT